MELVVSEAILKQETQANFLTEEVHKVMQFEY
jgi:hypothetical protein